MCGGEVGMRGVRWTGDGGVYDRCVIYMMEM
jgi:hypothetical protein